MKALLTLCSCVAMLLIGFTPSYAQSVGIGTTATTPHASSVLDVSSTDKGVLLPRMLAAQRAGIPSPATGLLVYQTDGVAGYYYYAGSGWLALSQKLYDNTYQVAGTASVTPASPVFQVVPGLTTTFTLPQSAKVFVTTYGGVQNTGATGTNAVVDVAIHSNGAVLASAGIARVTAANVNGATLATDFYSISAVLSLTPGTYTIDTQTRRVSGSNASVSGSSATVNQGAMTVQIIYR